MKKFKCEVHYIAVYCIDEIRLKVLRKKKLSEAKSQKPEIISA